MPRRSSARSHSITSQESYASVMIADVVADVPVDTVVEEDCLPDTKEETNLAYDAHLDADASIPSENSQKTNGAGISKGVILNAVQFGQNDPKAKGDEKAIPMSTSMQIPEIKQPAKEPNGFKDMSLGRKVAFGFSFLPSIFFVLCFAVILPCKPPKPCIHEVWSVELNNTEFTTRLEVPDNIVLTAIKQGQNVLLQLDKTSGILEEVELVGNSIYLKCGKITNKKMFDCVVMDKSGKLHMFNSSLDEIPTNITIGVDEKASLPAFLPNCHEDTQYVAIAVNNTKILLNNGQIVSDFSCDSVPIKMAAWEINGSANIISICEKNGTDRLISIPKNIWCKFKNSTEKTVTLQTGVLDSLKKSIFEMTDDGIVLWSGSEVSMIQPNGSILWEISNLSHHNENRFLLHGKFVGDRKQLIFISSNLSSGLEVTLLDPMDGKLVKNFNISSAEVTEVIRLEGKKNDFALLLLKKAAQDSVNRALNRIGDISTTIINLISNEKGPLISQGPFSEELALLDFDGEIDTLQILENNVKGGTYKSAMTAANDEKTGILSIYFVNTLESSSKKLTKVTNIDVANWDKSTKSKCTLK